MISSRSPAAADSHSHPPGGQDRNGGAAAFPSPNPKRRGVPRSLIPLPYPQLSRLTVASRRLPRFFFAHTTYDTSLTSAGAVVCSPPPGSLHPSPRLGRARADMEVEYHEVRGVRSVCSAQCGGRRLIFSLFSGAGRALDRPC